jgi:hypothetical protein
MPAQAHFRHFFGVKSEALADSAQKLYVATSPAPEGEAATQVNLPRLQAFADHVAQKILCFNLRKRLRESYDDDLLYAEHAEGFYLLVEGLQQGRSRLRVKHGARVRVKGYHRRHSAERTRTFDE